MSKFDTFNQTIDKRGISGQSSPSGRFWFLNKLEKPIDICQVAGTARAAYVPRVSAFDEGLVECLKAAIEFDGFLLPDI